MMVLRIFLTIVFALTSATTNAQDGRRDHRTKSSQVEVGQVTQNPNGPEGRLPNLPPLSGQTWHHWIVPGYSPNDQGWKDTSRYRLVILNVGNTDSTARVECYDRVTRNSVVRVPGRAPIKYKTKKILSPGVTMMIDRSESPQAWCRVSANSPIYAYGLHEYALRIFTPYQTERRPSMPAFLSDVIQGIPYPAE